jgi:hypothetical protein
VFAIDDLTAEEEEELLKVSGVPPLPHLGMKTPDTARFGARRSSIAQISPGVP